MKLPRVSSAHVISELKKRGFTDARYQGKGSHTALIRIDNTGLETAGNYPKKGYPANWNSPLDYETGKVYAGRIH